jgi:hypothetical protein
VLSPVDVYRYWKGKRDDSNILAHYAMRMFSRPISSAAFEKVFSFMEEMNTKDRQDLTPEKVLFVRGNSKTISSLLQDKNVRQIQDEIKQDIMKRGNIFHVASHQSNGRSNFKSKSQLSFTA